MDENDLTKNIGLRIMEYRKLRHLKRDDLAEKVDLSVAQIQKIEQGRGSTRIKTLIKLTTALEISPSFILSDISKVDDKLTVSLLDKFHHLSDSGKQVLITIAGELFKLENKLEGEKNE